MAHTTQVMPSLKAVNFNYFLSVERKKKYVRRRLIRT